MILYHASTIYHLLCCVVHRLAFYPNEDAQILMTEYIKPEKERQKFLKKLIDFKFFTKARYVPEQKIKLQKGAALNCGSSEKEIKTVANNICRAFENWFGEDIGKFSDFFVASDQHSLGIYLIMNKISYNYFEDAAGMLSQQDRYMSITKSTNMTNHMVNEYLGCMGRSKYVKKKLCDIKHQREGFYDEKAVDFCIYDILKNVIPDKAEVLLDFFGCGHRMIKNGKKTCLFLTQDLNTLAIKDLDLQELTMTTLVDYVCPGCTPVIKPHPKDRWQNYRRIFPDCVLLDRTLPSELLPFALENGVNTVLTASSTSIKGVESLGEKAYDFTTEIETHRSRIDDMYAAATVLKHLGIKSGVEIQNINKTQMSALLDCKGISASGGNILIDGGIKRNVGFAPRSYDLALYLNLGSVTNYSPAMNGRLYVITAEFFPESGSLMRKKTAVLFACTQNPEIVQKLESTAVEEHLKYTACSVSIRCRRADEETTERIKAKLLRDLEWEDIK